jgi:hypothetical protein
LKTIAIICVLLLIQGISYAQNNGPFGTNNGDGLRQEFSGQGNYNNGYYNNGYYYNNSNQQNYRQQYPAYNQRYSNPQYCNNSNYYAPNYNRYSTEGGVIFYPQIGVIYNNYARLPLTGFDRNGNELILMTGSRLDRYNHLENFYYYQMYHPRRY